MIVHRAGCLADDIRHDERGWFCGECGPSRLTRSPVMDDGNHPVNPPANPPTVAEIIRRIKSGELRFPKLPASAFPYVEEITRVEVIDGSGRAYVRWGVDVTYEVQDEGRTLKVFVQEPF